MASKEQWRSMCPATRWISEDDECPAWSVLVLKGMEIGLFILCPVTLSHGEDAIPDCPSSGLQILKVCPPRERELQVGEKGTEHPSAKERGTLGAFHCSCTLFSVSFPHLACGCRGTLRQQLSPSYSSFRNKRKCPKERPFKPQGMVGKASFRKGFCYFPTHPPPVCVPLSSTVERAALSFPHPLRRF